MVGLTISALQAAENNFLRIRKSGRKRKAGGENSWTDWSRLIGSSFRASHPAAINREPLLAFFDCDHRFATMLGEFFCDPTSTTHAARKHCPLINFSNYHWLATADT